MSQPWELLYDRLPSNWYVPPLRLGMVVGLAVAPDRSADYRIVVAGTHPTPTGSLVYGRLQPPHPLTIALWKAAGQATTPFLVARTPTLAPRTRATGECPDEVRGFAALGDAIDWIESEAKRLHAEGTTAEFVPGSREAVKIEQIAKFDLARLEAEQKAAAKAKVDAQNVGWTVRRGHRVAMPKP